MPNYLELIYNPNNFFEKAREEKIGFLKPLAIVLIAAILPSLSAALFADLYAKAGVELAISKGVPAEQAQMIYSITYYSTIISPFFVVFIMWLIFSAIMHGVSAIFNGKGDFSTTLKFVAFCFIPTIFLFPLNLKIAMDTAAIISVQGFEGLMGESIKITSASLNTISLGWQFILWTFAIKHARQLDFKKALTTAAIPALAYLILTWYSLLLL
jgi:hypothetical protein